MSSKTPIVRQVSWISFVPQLTFMGLLIFCFYLFKSNDPIIHGALAYLGISFGLRTLIPREHQQGMKLVKEQKFLEAIPSFEKSYEFFSKKIWIDKYRFLTLLSSSAMSYREMALCNVAFCYSQIGEGKKAIEYYTKTLTEFPNNGLAQAGLRMLHSSEGIKAVGE
jgi:tetratricopeptide (TPR) repeat protein